MNKKEHIRRLLDFGDADTSTGFVSIGTGSDVWVRDRNEEMKVIRRAQSMARKDGYDQIVYVCKNDGGYAFSRLYYSWFKDNAWDIYKIIAIVTVSRIVGGNIYKFWDDRTHKVKIDNIRNFLRTFAPEDELIKLTTLY